MLVVNPPEKMFVIITGLPRAGTTIVTSFLNSLEGATVWGEPHRSAGKSKPFTMLSRHAPINFKPDYDIVDQINAYADVHDLWLRGFKEVLDTNLKVFPIDIISRYEDRTDVSLVMFRDPRKTWSSMYAIGHNRGLGISVERFCDMYIELGEFCLEHENSVPVVMSKFISAPVAYMGKKLALEISGAPKLLQYTGGGDPHTIQPGTVIHGADGRPSYIGPELDAASKMYNEIVGMEKSNV